jgi:hypothetical protein
MSYAVEVLAADDDDQDLEPAAAALSKSRQWVLAALRAGWDMRMVKQVGVRLAQAGHLLKPRTIQTALGELEAAGLAAGPAGLPGASTEGEEVGLPGGNVPVKCRSSAWTCPVGWSRISHTASSARRSPAPPRGWVAPARWWRGVVAWFQGGARTGHMRLLLERPLSS